MLRRHDRVCSDPEHPEQAGGEGWAVVDTRVPIKMLQPWQWPLAPQPALHVQASLCQAGVADTLKMIPVPLL